MVVNLSANGGPVVTQYSTPISWSHDVGASDTLLLVFVVNGDYGGGKEATDVSYGTTDIYANQFFASNNDANVPQISMSAYYLLNPTPGTNTVEVSFPEYNAGMYGFSISYTGTVTTGNPIANIVAATCAANSLADLTTTSGGGDMAMGFCGMATSTITPGASQNNQSNIVGEGYTYCVSVDSLTGVSSPEFTWTGSGFGYNLWNAVVFDILAAGGSYVSPQQFKIFANGAFQANAFVQGGLPAGVGMRLYSNNVCQVGSLAVLGGSAGPRLFSNGQLQVASTIIA